jgi:hypothetical protein
MMSHIMYDTKYLYTSETQENHEEY